MIQNIDSILKALTNSSVRTGVRANTNAFGMSHFNTGGDEFVGKSSSFGTKVLKNFVSAHTQFDLCDDHRKKTWAKGTEVQTLSTPASANVLMAFVISSVLSTNVVIPSLRAPPRGAI